MKRILILWSLTIGALLPLQAQFGVHGGYQRSNMKNWEQLLNNYNSSANADLLPVANGWRVAVDYWFRLKNKRIEFLPEVGYGSTRSSASDATLTWNRISVALPVSFYLFDFEGDCNCPTFSKQGNTFAKGFFVQALAGANFNQMDIELISATTRNTKGNSTSWFAGLGAGLDIGVSDFLTITPYLRAQYLGEHEWPGLTSTFYDQPRDSNLNLSTGFETVFGIRAGFRLDEQKRRR